MDHVKVLTDIPVGGIQDYLANCQQGFETSQLYSSARNEKYTDEDLRKSVFRTIEDVTLFDKIENVLSKLNEGDSFYNYTLRRNDVTHIKYERGGFFKRHRDFLSTMSNLIEEFTLLLCVTPASEAKEVVIGGNTTIHTFGGSKIYDTTTTGSGILFRKDLEHEGMELMKGEKHIITANIWATRKEHSKQVLLVTFPPAKDPEGKNEAGSKLSIRAVANAETSYALPVDILSGTMLSTHVQWANRTAEQEGKDIPPVVTYECHDFDFDDFGVVEKVLNRSYVTEEDICDAKKCLDYFGPFKSESILVNLAVESKDEAQESDLPERASKKSRKKEPEKTSPESFDSDLIICETEARMRAVCSVAAALGEKHYVPFKILFVEGVLQAFVEGDTHAVEVPMMAAACLLGDHNNVFFLRKICQRASVKPKSFHEIHSDSNLFNKFPASIIEKILSNVPQGGEVDFFDSKIDWEGSHEKSYTVHRVLKENGCGLSLKVGLQTPDSIASAVVRSCLHDPYDITNERMKTVYLPGLGAKDEGVDDSASLFHRNEKGKVTFTEKEAERASNFIASSGLEERVKAALQKKRFVLPQETEQVEAHFCNEQVYGKINILWVSGVIRMEPDGGSKKAESASNVTFDAWPSDEAQAATENARQIISQVQSYGIFF